MTLSQWITANWVTPYIQKVEAIGEARGEARGRAKGISEGVAKRNAEWRAWLERKAAAEAQGLAFDEPLPDERE